MRCKYTPCKAEQPLKGIELQNKRKKNHKHMESYLGRTNDRCLLTLHIGQRKAVGKELQSSSASKETGNISATSRCILVPFERYGCPKKCAPKSSCNTFPYKT